MSTTHDIMRYIQWIDGDFYPGEVIKVLNVTRNMVNEAVRILHRRKLIHLVTTKGKGAGVGSNVYNKEFRPFISAQEKRKQDKQLKVIQRNEMERLRAKKAREKEIQSFIESQTIKPNPLFTAIKANISAVDRFYRGTQCNSRG